MKSIVSRERKSQYTQSDVLHWESVAIEKVQEYAIYYADMPVSPSEYAPMALYMWSKFYGLSCAFSPKLLYLQEADGIFWTPVGNWYNVTEEEWMCSLITQKGSVIRYAPESFVAVIQQYMPHVRIEEDRNSWDYLYNTEDLALLKGRKFAKKKNHINYFLKHFSDYTVLPITDIVIPQLIEEYMEYAKTVDKNSFLESEHEAILAVLHNFSLIRASGIVLLHKGRIFAFAIGEGSATTWIVQIEKALVDERGIYQVINQAFAQQALEQGYAVLNRCDDMGVLGLRQAKESYHPTDFLKKYTLLF